MRHRLLLLALFSALLLALLSCTMGGGRLAGVTATPTKTLRPVFTSTLTATPSPPPSSTPLPSATPIPPSATSLPSDTPPPTDTPLPPAPSAIPSDTPLPPTEAPAQPANTAAPRPTNTPLLPTNTPKSQVDFRVKEIVAFQDGSLTASGLHNIYFTVIDAAGNPLDGIVLEDVNNQPPEQVTTGNKGPGKTEFTMWAADYRFKVASNTEGRTFSSDTTHVLSVLYEHAVWDDLIRGGICPNEAACRALGPIHYSYNVTFQRTW